MKKIISLIVFVILLAWTWTVIHSDPSISFETHSIIQIKLAEIIEQSVQKHRPTAQNFNLVKLWTETLGNSRVKAYFTYKFIDGSGEESSEQTISGEAYLEKSSSQGSNLENWRVEKVSTNSNQVVFQEGTIISPEDIPESQPADSTNNQPSENTSDKSSSTH